MVSGKALGIPVVSLRYQNVYGVGQFCPIHTLEYYQYFHRIKNGKSINIFEDDMKAGFCLY